MSRNNVDVRGLVEFAETFSARLHKQAQLGKAAIEAQTLIDDVLLKQLQATIRAANDYISKAETGMGFAPESEIPF